MSASLQRPRHLRRILLIVVSAITMFGVSAAPTSAQPARPASLDGTWACSVLAGYTYDEVINQLAVCNPTGLAYSYRLRTAGDNKWLCAVPAGYTYDEVTNQLDICNPSGLAYSYRMRLPVNGLWACTVPPGFTYSQVMIQLDICDPSGLANSYRLVG